MATPKKYVTEALEGYVRYQRFTNYRRVTLYDPPTMDESAIMVSAIPDKIASAGNESCLCYVQLI